MLSFGLEGQCWWKWLVTLHSWLCSDAGRAGCPSLGGSGLQDPRGRTREAAPGRQGSTREAGPAAPTACPPAPHPTRAKPQMRATSDAGSGGGRVGQSEGAGHKRARVRHPAGAGISSVATVGGGPPGKGWEPLQYANVPWEFSHHQVLLTGGQQAAEGPQHG